MDERPLRGIPGDHEFVQNISAAIGFLVFNFALLEFALHAIVACIYHDMNGKKIVEPEIPTALGKVLTFLKTSVKKVPALSLHRETLLGIARDAKRLSLIRNDVVHGYLADYDGAKNHRLIFRKLSAPRPRTMHRETSRTITVSELMAAGSDAVGLTTRAGQLANGLVEAAVPKDTAHKRSGRRTGKRIVRRKAHKG